MRKTGFFAAILILTLALSSCGLITLNNENEETSASTSAITTEFFGETDPPIDVPTQSPPYIPDPQESNIRETEADNMLSKLLHIDFTGSTLFIVDCTGTFSSPLVENNVYSEALYTRNNKLSDKYGFKITVATAEEETLFEEYKATISSGNTFSDLLSVPLNDTGRFITSGLVKNLRSLAFFDHGADYAIPSFEKTSIAGNDSYFSVGYSTLTPSNMAVTYFNKALLDEQNIDLYGEILSGGFTIERYCEILRETEKATSVSPLLDLELISLEATAGSVITSGYGKAVSISESNAKSAISTSAYYLSSLTMSAKDGVTAENDFSIFEQGDVLFRAGLLSDMDELYDNKILWGIAPMPRHGDGDYVTPVTNNIAALMVTSNTAKTELCSVALNAINAASYKWLLDSAALHYATYRIPHMNSYDVIKIIIENPILDFTAGASSITDKVNTVIYSAIRTYAADSATDLSKILTSSDLKSITSALKKYYS